MSIPNYLYALANQKGPATVNAGGLSIPVKIMDIQHESTWTKDECTFKCMVVNPDQIKPDRVGGYCAPSERYVNPTDYVRAALTHAAAHQKASKPAHSANPFEIKKVYFNNPVTVVLWADGTKTIVRCQEGDVYSKETGLALCFTKKALGNKGNFNDVFHEWIPEEEVDVDSLYPALPPMPDFVSTGAAITKLVDEIISNVNKGGRYAK